MRKILFSLLLASAAATPALAGPKDDNDRHPSHAERQQAREERQQAHEERQHSGAQSGQGERPQFNGGNRFSGNTNGGGQPQYVRPERVRQDGQADNQDGRPTRAQIEAMRAQREANGQNQNSDGNRDWRTRRNVTGADSAVQQPYRGYPNGYRTRDGSRFTGNVPPRGSQPPLRTENRRHATANWNNRWRNDRRYDWRDYRRHNGSHFHLGVYLDPFSWGYQRFSVGWRLWPSYYSSNFWINDPWQYRLPYAPPGYQWVRYYNDAVLVDTWSGQVVDVIYSFFW